VLGLFVGGTGAKVYRPPVAVDHVTVMMTVSLRVMVAALLVKMVLHPWAHSCAMERSEWEARFGNTCAFRAETRMFRLLRLPVWVMVMMVPLVRETLMLVCLDVGTMLSRSVETLKKWPVAMVYIMLGGEETELVACMSFLLELILHANSTCFVGPPYQRLGTLGCLRRTKMASVPPILLSLVAAISWPSAGYWQVGLEWCRFAVFPYVQQYARWRVSGVVMANT
jgi:hypothetical protein